MAIGKSKIKPLLTAVEKAFKQLHTKGSYKPQDLAKTAEYKNLIAGTSQIFNTAITDNDIPEAMAKSLKEDVFVFSGLKTHAQLAEASKLLMTADGKIKSFSAFSKDVEIVKENYNQHYLEAEYQFAVSSSQSAGNWANLSGDYDLQYRTAGDDRVRDSHDKLRDVTLPQDDAFWISYYPPNGWRCRCTAVQVRKGKYEASDSKKAITEGEKATTQIDKNGKNKLAIFRFNPGIQKVVFPPTHPYAKVAGAKEVKNIILTIINGKSSEEQKTLRKAKDAEIKDWAKKNVAETGKIIKAKNFQTREIHISRGAIKSIGDHFSEPSLKEVAKNIISNLKSCKYIESAPLDKEKPNYQKKVAAGVIQFHYYEFEWNKQKFRLNTEDINGEFEKPYSANLIIKK